MTYIPQIGNPQVVKIGGSEVVLTAGSDLNRAAESGDARGLPWPTPLDEGYKRYLDYRPNTLRAAQTVTLPSNYGSVSSEADYGWRGREFSGIGNMPGPIPVATRPTYNNLDPILWRMRVLDPSALAQPNDLVQVPTLPTNPVSFTPAGAASIKETLL